MELYQQNWDKSSDEEIVSILASVKLGLLTLDLPVHTIIDRAVGISANEIVSNYSRLSYCPVKAMTLGQRTQYQRCSLPGREMFYGSLLPDIDCEI